MSRAVLCIGLLLIVLPTLTWAGGLSEGEIQEALIAYLQRQAPGGTELVQWDLRRGDTLPRDGRIVFLEKAGGSDWKDRVPIRLQVETRSGSRKTLWITADLIYNRDVVVACKTLPIGHVIGRGDVRMEAKNGGRLSEDHCRSIQQVLGQRVWRPVSKGTQLKTWHIKTNNAMRQGDLVKIIAQKGCVRVEAPGKLLEAGKIGDTLRVINLSSGKELHASAVDAQTVAVAY